MSSENLLYKSCDCLRKHFRYRISEGLHEVGKMFPDFFWSHREPLLESTSRAFCIFLESNNTITESFFITLPLMLGLEPSHLISLVLSSPFGSQQIALFQFGILLIYPLVALGMTITASQCGDVFSRSTSFLLNNGGLSVHYWTWNSPTACETNSPTTFKSGIFLYIVTLNSHSLYWQFCHYIETAENLRTSFT